MDRILGIVFMFKKLLLSLSLICTASLFSSNGTVGGWPMFCAKTIEEYDGVMEVSAIVEQMCHDDHCLPKKFNQYKSNDVKLLMNILESIYTAEAVLAKNKNVLSSDSYNKCQTSIDSYKKPYLKNAQDHSKLLVLQQQREEQRQSALLKRIAAFKGNQAK